MSAPLQRFRSYEIAEDPAGASLELWRTDREVVCLASLPADHRWVELHVIAGVDTQDPGSQPAVEHFRSQIHRWRRTPDRRVLEVLEAGEDEGALFYVSEFVDGETLDGYLARCTPLPAWWAVEIARQLTLGLLALRGAPELLSSAQVFNARLTLEGEATADALVKLADFSLGEAPPQSPVDPATAETRAVIEVGRLLCYAVSGRVVDPVGPRPFSGLPLPPEVADLLGRLLSRPGRPAPADLPGLLAALTASALSPGLPAVPPRLPPTLRPRLPLAAHFPTLPRLAAEIGPRLRLERTPFDAAHAYAQRAFSGTAAVMVQVLPPARLLAPTYLRLIVESARRAAARPTPHALRVLEPPSSEEPAWFLEEGPPRLSLDLARRLRRTLSPAEAAFLLREWDRAALALESRGLSPVALCPHEIFIEFAEAQAPPPGDEQLAADPVHAWPGFILKMRAHPVAVHLAQPRRFARERLLDPCPPRPAADLPPGPPSGLGAPTAADAAALFTWLCGGTAAVPRDLSDLVGGTLDGSRTLTRAAFMDAISPLIPRPPKPSAPKTKPASATDPASHSPPRGGAGGKPRRGKAARKSAAKAAGTAPATAHAIPAPSAANLPPAVGRAPAPPAAPATALVPEPEIRWENDGGPPHDPEPGGFAEVLLGSAPLPDLPSRTPSLVLLPAPDAVDAPENDLPVGALFGTMPTEALDAEEAPATSHRPFDFSPASHGRNPSGFWRLALLVVAVAMVIAALMAHFTGLAPWR